MNKFQSFTGNADALTNFQCSPESNEGSRCFLDILAIINTDIFDL